MKRRIVITGGSEGIGFAAARSFLDEGAKVLITGRSSEKLEKARALLASPDLHTLVWDVTDFSVLEENVRRCADILGGLDVFVNNAGVALDVDFHGDFFGVTFEKWDVIMHTNLKSMFFICQQVIRHMQEQKTGGCIINVGSEQGFRPGGITPYSISKCGVDFLTKGLGKTFVKEGIRINSVAPGATNTALQQADNILPAEKIADVIRFLASEQASGIAGETIITDRCEHLGVSWF